MGKQTWKPGNMLYPLPAVLVTAADQEGRQNVFTVAWTGTICSDPPMVSISVRPERYSYHMIEETGEFVINLTTKKLAFAADYCGVRSGRDVDKFKETHLTPVPGEQVLAPLIKESPVNLECKVTEIIKLGTHHMFLARVAAVHAEEAYLDEKGRFSFAKAEPLVYSHGAYFTLGKEIGSFGYSVRKKPDKKPDKKQDKQPGKQKAEKQPGKQKAKQSGRSVPGKRATAERKAVAEKQSRG